MKNRRPAKPGKPDTDKKPPADKIDTGTVEDLVRRLLAAIGEDPSREGLKETPRRVASFYSDALSGMHVNPEQILTVYYETEDYEEIVLEKNIPFYSLCEHHLLPFFGNMHIAYVPRKKRLLGISKLARVVDAFSRRLQLQERLTKQVADTVMRKANPLGVIVVCEAHHLCMAMRGVRKPGHMIVTSCVRGLFLRDLRARMEALQLIREHKRD